jgi:hypothetical protein
MTNTNNLGRAALGLAILGTPVVILFLVANLIFSNFHLSALLTKVEITEQIMEKTNAALQLNVVEGTGNQCIRLGIIGRQYCGVNEWDRLVRDQVSPRIVEGRNDLQLESFFFKRSVQVPFGGEFESVKNAYNLHLKAWVDFYSRTGNCQSYNCLVKESNDSGDIKSSFLISGRIFEEVIPVIDFKDSKVRIKEIFKS